MTMRTAGPDYWFLDPNKIDRLTEDECPMDEVQEGHWRELADRRAAAYHSVRCPHRGMGEHLPENCPAGGV